MINFLNLILMVLLGGQDLPKCLQAINYTFQHKQQSSQYILPYKVMDKKLCSAYTEQNRTDEAWVDSDRAPLRVLDEVPEYQMWTVVSQIESIGFSEF